MLVSEYQAFVEESDQFADRKHSVRLDIALYGLAGEVGSVVAAIKKRLLGPKEVNWRGKSEEIEEELGDALWYCFYVDKVIAPTREINILALDIKNLKDEIGADNDRARRIKGALTPERSAQFLEAAQVFPISASEIKFDDYQKLAFLTARTSDATLVEVCLAVLWQLNAELLRQKLPEIERELNRTLPDRDMNQVLGEIIWHLSALASLYNIKLSKVAAKNIKKVMMRQKRGRRTPLHDRNYKIAEQIPRKFEVSFVTLGNNKARMYFEGRQLGDPLTDNNYDDDGYRYHDVMHLANAAVLGWSPVLRKLLDCKRRSDRRIDEVEDGARAQIVEEAVIKAIHAEGVRLARSRMRKRSEPERLFPHRNDVSFRFLQLVRTFVSDLEARRNLFWEWEEAIFLGHEMFHLLRQEGQGTIIVDLEKQYLSFRPEVCVDINGSVAAFGSAAIPFTASAEQLRLLLTEVEKVRTIFPDDKSVRVQIARKAAILNALSLGDRLEALYAELDVTPLDAHRISVRGRGEVAHQLRRRNIIRFRTTLADSSVATHCTALGVADPAG
ncbi:MazG nucleotide pyrophosphohydrolase domain-containing protein [Nitrospirillum bahiense]|uniref:MazG-like nucleotide pyrophosphohydrolase family protein n=1 Tax=Nitrospirillum amazonense TaxID=28077 RepID=A0A560FMN2_9PROT|nr:MazG nucleotide pyrophosphohydrolase domain-containing protein [Nitrospirillum amazonense]TWB22889.1 MazG-like nucleotide pyrophosphohydrolase family protein [Nitrospirillum amazonense]